MTNWQENALEQARIADSLRPVTDKIIHPLLTHLINMGIPVTSLQRGKGKMISSRYSVLSVAIDGFFFEWAEGDSGNLFDGAIYMAKICPICGDMEPLGRITDTASLGRALANANSTTALRYYHECKGNAS